jgi:hypothetical protein
MIKKLACLAILSIVSFTLNGFGSPAPSNSLAAVVAGKQIYGKGVHNQCLPYALGLSQTLHDQYKVKSVGIVYTWVVSGFPMTTGRHIVVAYTTQESGVTRHWIADNETKYPLLVQGNDPVKWISSFNRYGNFKIDRILQLPLTNMEDKEYIGSALMAGTLTH